MNNTTLTDLGTIAGILISVATLIGFLISNAKARGAREQIMKEIDKRLCEAEKGIEENYSSRNKTNIAIEGLGKTFEANMEWIKDTFREIKEALVELRRIV
jgi:hypothetical protein